MLKQQFLKAFDKWVMESSYGNKKLARKRGWVQLHSFLSVPEHLVIFDLGEWKLREALKFMEENEL